MPRNPAADERRRRERREEILSVAEQVVGHEGAGSAVDAIAKRLGISKGTIYLYFPAKDQLLLEVFRRAVDRTIGRMREIAGREGDPAERLEALVRASVEFIEEQRLVLRMIMEGPVPLRAEMRRLWSRPVRALYVRLLDEGRRTGIFRPHDPDVVSHCAVTLGRGAMFYEGKSSLAAFADEAATLLVRSLLVHPRTQARTAAKKTRSKKERRR